MSDYSDLKLMAECAIGFDDVSLAPDVLLELIFDNERLLGYVRSIIDQTTPLVPIPGDPMWSRRITIDDLIAENESLRKDAELGRIALKYFDRMDDPDDCDPLEKSVSEFLAAICSAISSPENPS